MDSYRSPQTPIMIRQRKSSDKKSPPASVRSNLFQSIIDAAENSDYSSPLRTPMSVADPAYSDNSLDARMVLLSCDNNVFGNYLEDFNIVGVIGSGSFSEVCKVESKRVAGHFFAMKRSNRTLRSGGDRERLLQEVRAMKDLNNHQNSPYIPQFFAAWQENGFLYMIMEHADYGNINDIIARFGLRRQPMPDLFIWRIIHDICQGLSILQHNGYVHLDVKPANLLIFGDRNVKLADYGMATRIGRSQDDREGDSRYLAIELLNDDMRQPSADIFSLGISLYEIANIHHMEPLPTFDGLRGNTFSLPTEGDEWHVFRDGRAPPLPERSTTFNNLIQSMLHPNTEARPSAEQILMLPEVIAAAQAGNNAFEQLDMRIVIPRPVINRSSSFDPIFMD